MATEQHHESPHELLASERKPVTDATLTIRIIKSFEYRTMKPLVLKDLDLESCWRSARLVSRTHGGIHG
jgi:hypothetical protein